jgi:hypothetical protein
MFAKYFIVDSTELEEQREVLTELCYYQLGDKGKDIVVPILVIDDDEDDKVPISYRYKSYFGEEAITKLKEMLC